MIHVVSARASSGSAIFCEIVARCSGSCSNWSGRVTVKEGHELTVAGPYAIVRHPIYTGLLLAALGTGITIGEARCILGLALLILAFIAKIGQEEQLMLEIFPQAYPTYRLRVKALIPGVF